MSFTTIKYSVKSILDKVNYLVYSKIIDRTDYNKLIHNICIEVSEKKITEVFFKLSEKEREKISIESWDSFFNSTKSD